MPKRNNPLRVVVDLHPAFKAQREQPTTKHTPQSTNDEHSTASETKPQIKADSIRRQLHHNPLSASDLIKPQNQFDPFPMDKPAQQLPDSPSTRCFAPDQQRLPTQTDQNTVQNMNGKGI